MASSFKKGDRIVITTEASKHFEREFTVYVLSEWGESVVVDHEYFWFRCDEIEHWDIYNSPLYQALR